MNPLIFREYDIRGVADRDLTDDLALNLGRAFGTFLSRRGQNRIVVGRDCRLSSPRLHQNLTRGLLETVPDRFDARIARIEQHQVGRPHARHHRRAIGGYSAGTPRLCLDHEARYKQ